MHSPPSHPFDLPQHPAGSTGPFKDVRIVELAGVGPAQLGGMLLADLGANVIRVDHVRHVPRSAKGRSPELLARGRRSLALDLQLDDGTAALRRLLERSDVLLDPYRPGVTERLGVGPDVALGLNPRLIYARMTGWGQNGPLAQAAGHDINYIALAGALDAIGEAGAPPPVPLNLIGDFGGGAMLLAFGVAAALFEREQSGLGQVIDVAMIDGVASLMTSILQLQASGVWQDGRGTNWLQGAAPWYRAYETADGRYLTIGAPSAKFYDQLLRQLGLDPADWPQWNRDTWPKLTHRLQTLFRSKPLAAWRGELEGTDVCFAPALELDELLEHPHLVARGTYVRRDGVTQAAPAPRFARTPGSIGSPPPWPGEHTLAVLADLGYEPGDAQGLIDAQAARQFDPQQRSDI